MDAAFETAGVLVRTLEGLLCCFVFQFYVSFDWNSYVLIFVFTVIDSVLSICTINQVISVKTVW